MKNQLRRGQKLTLRKETIRQLDKLELSNVDGGLPTTFTQLTCNVDRCATRPHCVTTPVP